MSTLREQLLAEIERFLRVHEMRETTFGREAVNDTAFVSRLRAGRDPKTSMVDRVRGYIARHSAPPRPKSGRNRKRPKSSPARALAA